MMRTTIEQQSQALSHVTELEKAARGIRVEAEKEAELLKLDKVFLQREVQDAKLAAEEGARQVHESRSKILGLEIKVFQFIPYSTLRNKATISPELEILSSLSITILSAIYNFFVPNAHCVLPALFYTSGGRVNGSAAAVQVRGHAAI